VDAHEVVEGEVERERVNVVRELLGEGVRQPSEPAHAHSHGQIVPLDVRRADVLRIWVTLDSLLPRAEALRRAVAALGSIRNLTVELHKLGIVDVATERALNRLQIGPVPVRR